MSTPIQLLHLEDNTKTIIIIMVLWARVGIQNIRAEMLDSIPY